MAKTIIAQCVQAVCEMHELGFCHRDIKPANILINDRGRAVLTDFGTSKKVSPEEVEMARGQRPYVETTTYQEVEEYDKNRQQSFVGTQLYLPPEMYGRNVMYVTPLDAYSLGCVFHEILTGRPMLGIDRIEWQRMPGDQQELLRTLLDSNPLNRLQGGWAYIKRLKYFKGVDFANVGQLNVHHGEKKPAGPSVTYPGRDPRLSQYNYSFARVLGNNEKVVECMEGLRYRAKNACALFTSRWNLILAEEKQHCVIPLLAEDFRFYELGRKLVLEAGGEQHVLDGLSRQQVALLAAKIVQCYEQDGGAGQECPHCGHAEFYDRYCHRCFCFIAGMERRTASDFARTDQRCMPFQLRARLLALLLREQEAPVAMRDATGREGRRLSFADLFEAEGDNTVAEPPGLAGLTTRPIGRVSVDAGDEGCTPPEGSSRQSRLSE